MTRHAQPARVTCALALYGCIAPAWGAGTTHFSAEVGLGGEYDSNVSINELDASSGRGDYALTADAQLKVDYDFTPYTDVSATYNFSHTAYQEFDRLDRQTHLLGLDFAHSFKPVTSGVTLYYINAQLDGNDFLEYYRASPYVSGFMAKKWFVRGAYVYSDKSIDQNPGRDADSHAGEFDLYYFRRGLRSYFNAGYKYKNEDAVDAPYDYVSNTFKLRYIHRAQWWDKVVKFELSWRFENRDYSSITPSIGEKRGDKRHRWALDMEYPVFKQGAIELFGGYSDYSSNYPSADYDQYLVGTRMSYRW